MVPHRAGDDYVREVFDRLRECSVLPAVIGPRWAAVTGNGAFDWVHREIHEALTSGMRVVPVLIEDAKLPAKSDLPTDIADLRGARRCACGTTLSRTTSPR
jgi:hypothetical protein